MNEEELYRRHSAAFDKLHASEQEDELVEKMARAIYDAYCVRVHPDVECIPWQEIDEEFREDHRYEARAALAAARPVIRAQALEEVLALPRYGYVDHNQLDIVAGDDGWWIDIDDIRALKEEE